jgi:hypothetical protein
MEETQKATAGVLTSLQRQELHRRSWLPWQQPLQSALLRDCEVSVLPSSFRRPAATWERVRISYTAAAAAVKTTTTNRICIYN